MPNHDPNFGIAFIVGILMVAIFATLFPEKEPEPKNTDSENKNKNSPAGTGE